MPKRTKRPAFTPILSALALGLAVTACGLPDESPPTDQPAARVEQPITAVPLCGPLVVTELQQKFCGPQTGPFDTSPVLVECTRTCTTTRHMNLLTRECVSDETTCTGWVCPPCDP
jgi:hypothetical protein